MITNDNYKKYKKKLTRMLNNFKKVEKHNKEVRKIISKMKFEPTGLLLQENKVFLESHKSTIEEREDILYKCFLDTPWNKKQKVLVSVSGGRTSGYMAHYLKENYSEKYDFTYLYSNTSQEHENTLKFLNSCDLFFDLNLVWIEGVQQEYGKSPTYKIVDYKTASVNGEVFEEMIKKHGIPNMSFPHCTRELKINPIRAYRKDKNIVAQAIGIRSDELIRATPKDLVAFYDGDLEMVVLHRKHIDFIWYPLIEDVKARKEDIVGWWSKMPFDLELDGDHYGNCVTCWKKSKRKLMTIAKNDPKQFDFFKRMEAEYSTFIPPTQKNKRAKHNYFNRNHQSVESLIMESNNSIFPEYKKEFFQPNLFSCDPELDEEFSCNECGTIF